MSDMTILGVDVNSAALAYSAFDALALAQPGSISVYDQYNISEDVILEISSPYTKEYVKTVMPPNFGFSVSNKWSSALGSLGDSGMLAAFDKVLQSTTGTSLAGNPLLNRVTYGGTEPISFNLKLQFASLLRPKEDVWDKVVLLYKMATPSQADSTLRNVIIPGPIPFPELAEATQNVISYVLKDKKPSSIKERPLTVRFGTLFRLKRCFIKSLTVTFESHISAGYPVAATVDLTIGSQESFVNTNLDAINSQLRSLQKGTPTPQELSSLESSQSKSLGMSNMRDLFGIPGV